MTKSPKQIAALKAQLRAQLKKTLYPTILELLPSIVKLGFTIDEAGGILTSAIKDVVEHIKSEERKAKRNG